MVRVNKPSTLGGRMKLSLRTATQQPVFRALESDASSASEQARIQDFVKAKRSDLRNGLTRRAKLTVPSEFRTERRCGLELKTTPSGLAHDKRFETKLSKRGTKRFGAYIPSYPDRKSRPAENAPGAHT